MENEKLTDDEIKREKRREVDKKYRERNKEKRSEYQKEYQEKNKEIIKNKKKQCYEANTQDRKKYLEVNKDRISEYQKEYQEKNKESIAKRKREYYNINKESVMKWNHLYVKNRCRTDIKFKLLYNCRNRLKAAIKRNSKSAPTKKLIGCTIEELKQHLEAQFTEGMTFNNYGQWHIDHRIPCSSFDFAKEEDQRECFNYKNLQPLWARDNLIKGSKY